MSQGNLALVADLNGDSFAQLQPVLKDLGLEPVLVHDGVQALRLAAQSPPSLVLAETRLEVLDGFALCARLRQEEITRSIPIVLMGTADDREGRLAALGAGADDFIGKPLDAEDARLRLTALLRRARLKSSTNGNRHAMDVETPIRVQPADTAKATYARLVAFVNHALEQARKNERLDLEGIDAVSRQLVQELHRTKDTVALALARTEIEDLAAHHANVAVIGLRLAEELGLPPDLQVRFARLALVHDLGMVKVPSAILYAPRRLTREEFHIVKEHPRHTNEMLRCLGADYEELAELAYQEHEREKGQGYPRGLQGEQLNELGKILAVADVFEALTHPRSYRKALIAYDALQELIEMRGDFFHPHYIRTLMNALTVFPLGSWVQLNTGEIGLVRSTNGKNLMRPIVEILWSARGERLERHKRIDLAKSPFLFINKPLYEEQLPRA